MKKRISAFLLSLVLTFAIILPVFAATHSTAPYDKLKNRTLTVSGDGVIKIMTFTLTEIEKMESRAANYTYRIGKKAETALYQGVPLISFLELAGLKSSAKGVRLTSSNGKILILSIDSIQKSDYVNEVNDSLLLPMLAYSKNDLPLVQTEKSEGYDEENMNHSGPLFFIIGQNEKKESNGEKYFADVTKIEVLTTMPKSRFSDITPSFMWAEEYIEKLTEKEIMVGVTEDKFNPDGLITRGEMAEIFVKALNLTLRNTYAPHYADVEEDHPLENYISTATDAGLFIGKGNSNFDPKGYVTKNEIAVIAIRAMGMSQDAIRMANPTISFKDSAEIPSWALSYISVGEKNMLFDKNFAYEYFNGEKQVSRAEAASIVYRAIILK